jgi:hypothetical protein
MKKLIISLSLGLLSFNSLKAQLPALHWAKTFGLSTHSISCAKTDASGNVYSVGYFNTTIDLDPGPGVYTVAATSNWSAYILKLNSAGNFIWASAFSPSTSFIMEARSIDIDVSNNVYIVGRYGGVVDFDPGPGTYTLNCSFANGYILKLDQNGNFIWVKEMTGGVVINDIKLDPTGNIYTGGVFYDGADFDPGPGTYSFTSAFPLRGFISKLDASGNFAWARAVEGQTITEVSNVELDGAGNVYTSGWFDGTNDFDPGPGVFNLTPVGNRDPFIYKLDPAGNFIWAKSIGNNNDNYWKSSVDAAGNVYLTGDYNGQSLDLDPGPGTITAGPNGFYVIKLDNTGSLVWAKTTTSGVSGDVATILSGGIYIAGEFTGTVDFDPNPGTSTLTTTATDMFILKMDAAGNLIWAKNTGGIGAISPTAISTDISDNLYSVGTFTGNVDFDPASGITNPGSASDYLFIMKIAPCCSGIESNENILNPIKVFPNPNNGHFTLINELDSKVILVNSLGQVVLEEKCSSGQTIIDIESFPKGIYLLKTIDKSGMKSSKMIIE